LPCSGCSALHGNPIGVRRLQSVQQQKVPKVARRWRSLPQQSQRWRMVNFLTVKTTVPRPQVLAVPPACARARPGHDPMLTHASSPCAPAGQPAVLLLCFLRRALVAEASRELQTCGGRRNAAARAEAGGGSAGLARGAPCVCTCRAVASCMSMALRALLRPNARSCVDVCSYFSGWAVPPAHAGA